MNSKSKHNGWRSLPGVTTYDDYLKTHHWSIMVRKHRKKSCFCCSARIDLALHHITYANCPREKGCDFSTVCRECHTAIHAMEDAGVPLGACHVRRKWDIDNKSDKVSLPNPMHPPVISKSEKRKAKNKPQNQATKKQKKLAEMQQYLINQGIRIKSATVGLEVFATREKPRDLPKIPVRTRTNSVYARTLRMFIDRKKRPVLQDVSVSAFSRDDAVSGKSVSSSRTSRKNKALDPKCRLCGKKCKGMIGLVDHAKVVHGIMP